MKPVIFTWSGDAMEPQQRFRRLCDRQYVIGEHYALVPQEDRSASSHRHYFASLHDAWLNLPEDQAERFPTSEHLRKYALIRAGYYDERSIVCASKAEAQRIAAFVKPMDEYAVVIAREATVRVFTAKSQSLKAMGRKAFQNSKQKVLDIVADMIGVDAARLQQQAGLAA